MITKHTVNTVAVAKLAVWILLIIRHCCCITGFTCETKRNIFFIEIWEREYFTKRQKNFASWSLISKRINSSIIHGLDVFTELFSRNTRIIYMSIFSFPFPSIIFCFINDIYSITICPLFIVPRGFHMFFFSHIFFNSIVYSMAGKEGTWFINYV